MNNKPFLVPKALTLYQEEIKKSVFITQLKHTSSITEAKTFIEYVKNQHATARHNCWGFSDDGEPSGTAGKPILAQLSGSGVGEITAVVSRYYGGIKLGTGGLVRAYGGSVQKALKLLQTIEKKITTKLLLQLDYGFVAIVQGLLVQFDAQEVEADYSQQVKMVVDIEQRYVSDFTQSVINKSGAKILVTPLGDKQ
ncbi:YigZ family protein [Vibrio zhanjiangensis]|uniref:YigZ family protein n=1 Tax=Vibrio zhanjiangensis TaxID=1046128 RepID=A0ABQ6F667_9VIBR|nr:YigZ family protein [Vibrio zhanjiangensis]GLT20311.1 YigZ family protein [Vibrio zhanjiangensis]